MQLDQRSSDLLNEIIKKPGLKSKDLESKYVLNRRQLKYSFDKINDWLKTKNLPKIERTKQGLFIVDPIVSSALLDEDQEYSDDNILSEREREDLLIFLLLSKQEEFSLVHFTSTLDVSKNTVLSDLRKVQERLTAYQLEITYTRREGYELSGKEFSVRKLLINTVHRIMERANGMWRILEMGELDKSDIQTFHDKIQNIEQTLQLKFTDEKIETMPYVLSLLLRRMKQSRFIDPFYIHYEELMDTKEWKATEEILENQPDVPMEERLFITLHLLTANVYWAEDLTEESIPELLNTLQEVLHQFEKRSCIYLHNKEQLLHRLLLHVKPAYYRVKYKLTEMNEWHHTVSEEFQELHHLVKQSTGPLRELIGEVIPDSETAYLTMLIGGWLTKQGDSIHHKTKALVVCPHGVSVSRLLLGELKELFPELVFLDALSVRDFRKYDLEYDVVFSPVFVHTEAKLFIVSKILNPSEKQRLRQQVMSELHGYTPEHLSVDYILEIIHKHVDISQSEALAQELDRYLHKDVRPIAPDPSIDRKPHLYEIVTQDRMTLLPEAQSWEEALRKASDPLLLDDSITENYVNEMLTQTDPYIVLGNNVAIPHANPEKGVKNLAISFLRLKESIDFDTNHEVQFIFIIAALDKHHHLQALRQIMKLSQHPEDIKAIEQASTKQDIQTVLQQYAYNEPT
ncbi:PRD domain-containing protein [Salibacterium salarium]|uniref:Ascorbate-specific PTS system EIIA component n=1 Tax=Salibacterium salarium TaxID=284579 RepID=A0A428MWN4_9BACI|nr:BglG family transcription antiterminator [Salibacterium salarium]RSL30552.1 PRD domain-containing protein [Salibacterium salarium]